jgi:hypothetical protein
LLWGSGGELVGLPRLVLYIYSLLGFPRLVLYIYSLWAFQDWCSISIAFGFWILGYVENVILCDGSEDKHVQFQYIRRTKCCSFGELLGKAVLKLIGDVRMDLL